MQPAAAAAAAAVALLLLRLHPLRSRIMFEEASQTGRQAGM